MSDDTPPKRESSKPPKLPPRRTRSGENEAVREFRDKLDSIQDGTLEDIIAANREYAERKAATIAPKADPRREAPDDERRDDTIPVDIVPPPSSKEDPKP